LPDFKPHCLNLAAQFMIPEAQNLNPLAGEELVSLFVSCPPKFIWRRWPFSHIPVLDP
jgi:hypothetical protein